VAAVGEHAGLVPFAGALLLVALAYQSLVVGNLTHGRVVGKTTVTTIFILV
jgi:uncharacterized protein (DUF2062 family)